jgi:hypothetical protein
MTVTSDVTEKIQDCGRLIEEAKDQGCKFDVLTDLWVPSPIFDGELTEEYLSLEG